MEYFKHPTAIVDEGAKIGKDTKVWHWVHICKSATIGERCVIGQNVFVANNVSIGSNVKIQNNVSVFEGVILEDNVFCGPSMVFTNIYNPRSEIVRKGQYKTTIVRQGVTFGANSTILCGITIGEYAFIGAGSVVSRDVKPFALMMGVPAKQTGWMSHYGEKLDLPIIGSGEVVCNNTNIKYILEDSNLRVEK